MNNKIELKDKIFVAGSSGMVGASICKKLREKGYVDSNKGGTIFAPNRNNLNLLDYSAVDRWFRKNHPDIVILAAAKVGGIKANNCYPADFILENLKIQNNVIECSWRHKVKRFLFLGSSCIYPKYANQPIKEEYLLNGILEPTNEYYAIAKISGIKLCEALRKQYNFNSISLMPTNLYGPGDNYHPENSHVMASLIRKFCEAKKFNHKTVTCWGTGSPMREFMHVDDLSSAALFVLEKWFPSQLNEKEKRKNIETLSFLNVGTGKDISIFNLAKMISEIVQYNGEIVWDKTKPDGTPKKQLDITRIKKLGWEPRINLEYGIQKTIKDYLEKMDRLKDK